MTKMPPFFINIITLYPGFKKNTVVLKSCYSHIYILLSPNLLWWILSTSQHFYLKGKGDGSDWNFIRLVLYVGYLILSSQGSALTMRKLETQDIQQNFSRVFKKVSQLSLQSPLSSLHLTADITDQWAASWFRKEYAHCQFQKQNHPFLLIIFFKM